MLAPGRQLPLIAVEAFEAAARHQSFARAASELGTSAASVSYHVKRLESVTGVTLFRRLAQRVELTEDGKAIAVEATQLIKGIRASFDRARVRMEQALAVTALPSFGAAWLVPRLGNFRSLNPEVRITLDLTPDVRGFGPGEFDVAVRNGDGSWPALNKVRLFPSLFMPLCSPSLLQQLSGRCHWSEEVPLLGRPDWWALWLDRHGPAGAGDRDFRTNLAAEHLDVAAAVAGQGMAIASPLIFLEELQSGRLVPVEDRISADGRTFWLCWPQKSGDRAALDAFKQWVIAEAQDTLRHARGYFEERAPSNAPGTPLAADGWSAFLD